MDWDHWIDYDKEFRRALEVAATQRAKQFETRPRGNVVFSYNLQGMYQENMTTHTRRPMRRVLWWITEADKYPKRKQDLDQHNKDHSDPKAGRRPSASPPRVRSRSQSQVRDRSSGPPYGGSAPSARGSAG